MRVMVGFGGRCAPPPIHLLRNVPKPAKVSPLVRAAGELAKVGIVVAIENVRIGSLEKGKDASLAVFTGDPLLTQSVVVALYEKGVRLDLMDRHKRLWERYRNRPKPAPPAPGGL
jgi:hypothetical protein